MIKILPYKQGSKGARSLAEALTCRVLKLEGSRWKPRQGDVVINWGNTTYPQIPYAKALVLNEKEAIRQVSNKLTFFNLFYEGNENVLPRYWTAKEEIPEDSFPIVCRTILNGHSGAGITIANSRDDLVDAPLYVEYKKKKDEYRVHFGKESEQPFLIQRKARRADHEEPNWQVRNHANGFIYVRNDVNPPACVTESALQIFRSTNLDFGAVDVIYNEREGRAYVLEINTAPGLEGQTVEDYATYFEANFGG